MIRLTRRNGAAIVELKRSVTNAFIVEGPLAFARTRSETSMIRGEGIAVTAGSGSKFFSARADLKHCAAGDKA
jgi:hypothetical protein